MSPEAGHVVVHYVHLAAPKSWVLEQVELVVWTVLGTTRSWRELAAPLPRMGAGQAPGAGKDQDPTK